MAGHCDDATAAPRRPTARPLINELGELIRQARQEAITHIREMILGTGDIVGDPAVLKRLGLPNAGTLQETDLEQALIDQLQGFLLELGKGFAFIARQQRISTESKDFYIDLVFYNYLLKCFVIVDLKRGELSHQDIGQMDMYVRLYDDLKRGPDDKPTVGIILCAQRMSRWCVIPCCRAMNSYSPASISWCSPPKKSCATRWIANRRASRKGQSGAAT